MHAVVGRDEPTLRSALAQLEDSELVFRLGAPPDARYAFKHALVQDTAYESLLKSRRQILHQKIADTMREKFPGVVEAEPELLAHHFTQAGLTAPAIEYWGKAGDLALRRSAFKEAIAHLGKAIELSDKKGPATPPRAAAASASQRLKLQANYGQAVMWSKGYAAVETKAAFARVGELAKEMRNAEVPGETYYARWTRSLFRGELGSAREAAESFLCEAESEARLPEAGVAHRVLGLTLLFQGNFAQARAHLEQALRIYSPERDLEAKFRPGLDPKVTATAYLACAAWPLGDVERARELIEEAKACAAESAHVPTVANMYGFNARLEILRDDAEAARRAAAACVALGREHGLALYLAAGTLTSAWARAKLGDRDAGASRMLRQAMADNAMIKATGCICHLSRGAARGNRPRREARKPPSPGIDGRAGAGRRDWRALVRRRTPPHSRRNHRQAKPR